MVMVTFMLKLILEIFISTLNKFKGGSKPIPYFFKKYVMGLIDKIKQNQPEPQLSNQLNSEELEVLLSLIKKSSFLGEDIEPLYNMVVKLQNQYIEQTK
jgi:hypothetical protein